MAQTLTLANLEKALEKNNATLKQWVNTQIANNSTFSISWIEELPTENISTSTIYMLKNTESTDENNIYDEYVYNETSGWEVIGSLNTGSVDLSEYYNKTETYSKEEIDYLLANFKSVTISSAENNAVVENEDGLFVEDKTSEIETLTTKVNEIKKYQKFVNTNLQYGYFSSGTTQSISTSTNILSCFTNKISTLEITEDGYLKLEKGRSYLLHGTFYKPSASSSIKVHFCIIDSNGNVLNQSSYVTANEAVGTDLGYIFDELSEDTYIGIYPDKTVTLDIDISNVTIQEIGRQIAIDPVEHINTIQGLEDTPVGSTINYIGETPKHYLPCDGGIYNITDYPHLAEYIKTTYGSYNYFGGDGEATFGIQKIEPTLIADNSTSLPTMTSATTPAPYVVTCSSYFDNSPQHNGWHIFDGSTADVNCWASGSGKTSDQWVMIDMNEPYTCDTLILKARNSSSYGPATQPRDFRLQGSNNGEEFDTIITVTGQTWGTTDVKEWTFDKVSYRYYRLYVNSVNGGSFISVGEMDLIYENKIYSETFIKYEPTYFMVNENTNYLMPNLYSEEEKIVGCWIDGKPLYQKTIVSTMPQVKTNGTSVDLSIDISALYINTFLDNSSFILSEDSTSIPCNTAMSASTITYISTVLYTNQSLLIRSNNTTWNDRMIYITIRYTKTTDEENSFTIDMIKDFTVQTETAEEYTEEDVTNAINELW